MRYIKIKIECDEGNYIFLHKALKQFLDEKTDGRFPFYEINSWSFKE